jgi:hypothetical protein
MRKKRKGNECYKKSINERTRRTRRRRRRRRRSCEQQQRQRSRRRKKRRTKLGEDEMNKKNPFTRLAKTWRPKTNHVHFFISSLRRCMPNHLGLRPSGSQRLSTDSTERSVLIIIGPFGRLISRS